MELEQQWWRAKIAAGRRGQREGWTKGGIGSGKDRQCDGRHREAERSDITQVCHSQLTSLKSTRLRPGKLAWL